jgi:hypothetical protein
MVQKVILSLQDLATLLGNFQKDNKGKICKAIHPNLKICLLIFFNQLSIMDPVKGHAWIFVFLKVFCVKDSILFGLEMLLWTYEVFSPHYVK